jgi:N-acetyl-1-D-myo-inositol-2-amino-2-deoxy-alpha-D-glucopyranoside deacetylase
VAWRAFELAGGLVSKFYATALPSSVLAESMTVIRGSESDGSVGGGADVTRALSAGELRFAAPDDQVTTEIDARALLDAKLAAMHAHATQIAVDSPFYALSNNVRQLALGREYYILLAGPRGAATGPQGRETDLFAAVS